MRQGFRDLGYVEGQKIVIDTGGRRADMIGSPPSPPN
jgi:hypothetical protein